MGDYDGDGFPDVYLSGFRTGILLHNEAGKGFKDATPGSGLTPQPWGTACAWVETVPGSGRLDLIVGNYARFGPGTDAPVLCPVRDRDGKPLTTACPPRHYAPLKPAFFQNRGGGKFQDATKAAGFLAGAGRTLGIAAADFDGSGKQSISFANDEAEGDLFQRKGAGFENIARRTGTNVDRDGAVHGGMGTDWGDYDNDGKLDLIVATYAGEAKSLYRNEGDGVFTDLAYPAGTSPVSQPYVSFGVKFFDADNDGWLDLAIANGHVQDNIEKIDTVDTYRQPTLLLRNLGGAPGKARYEDLSKSAGAGFTKPLVGRGLASGDYDNDGRVDLLVVDSEGSPSLLHNDSPVRHWLGVRLIGQKSNRDGYGAILTLKAGGKTLVRHCHADGSYLSSSDPRVHFGLGDATKIDSLTVRWPSGATQSVEAPPLDRYITLTEGKTP